MGGTAILLMPVLFFLLSAARAPEETVGLGPVVGSSKLTKQCGKTEYQPGHALDWDPSRTLTPPIPIQIFVLVGLLLFQMPPRLRGNTTPKTHTCRPVGRRWTEVLNPQFYGLPKFSNSGGRTVPSGDVLANVLVLLITGWAVSCKLTTHAAGHLSELMSCRALASLPPLAVGVVCLFNDSQVLVTAVVIPEAVPRTHGTRIRGDVCMVRARERRNLRSHRYIPKRERPVLSVKEAGLRTASGTGNIVRKCKT